jgi:hypothetical protein
MASARGRRRRCVDDDLRGGDPDRRQHLGGRRPHRGRRRGQVRAGRGDPSLRTLHAGPVVGGLDHPGVGVVHRQVLGELDGARGAQALDHAIAVGVARDPEPRAVALEALEHDDPAVADARAEEPQPVVFARRSDAGDEGRPGVAAARRRVIERGQHMGRRQARRHAQAREDLLGGRLAQPIAQPAEHPPHLGRSPGREERAGGGVAGRDQAAQLDEADRRVRRDPGREQRAGLLVGRPGGARLVPPGQVPHQAKAGRGAERHHCRAQERLADHHPIGASLRADDRGSVVAVAFDQRAVVSGVTRSVAPRQALQRRRRLVAVGQRQQRGPGAIAVPHPGLTDRAPVAAGQRVGRRDHRARLGQRHQAAVVGRHRRHAHRRRDPRAVDVERVRGPRRRHRARAGRVDPPVEVRRSRREAAGVAGEHRVDQRPDGRRRVDRGRPGRIAVARPRRRVLVARADDDHLGVGEPGRGQRVLDRRPARARVGLEVRADREPRAPPTTRARSCPRAAGRSGRTPTRRSASGPPGRPRWCRRTPAHRRRPRTRRRADRCARSRSRPRRRGP